MTIHYDKKENAYCCKFYRDDSQAKISYDFCGLTKLVFDNSRFVQNEKVGDAIRKAQEAVEGIYQAIREEEPPIHEDWIRVGLLESAEVRLRNYEARPINHEADISIAEDCKTASHICYIKNDISNYWAQVTRDFNGHYYLRVGDAAIQIYYSEYCDLRQNPSLYYFSTAFKLHNRLLKAGMTEKTS